jgi:hypothetical protein
MGTRRDHDLRFNRISIREREEARWREEEKRREQDAFRRKRAIREKYQQRGEYSTTECIPGAKSETMPEYPLRNRTKSDDGKNDAGVRRLG